MRLAALPNDRVEVNVYSALTSEPIVEFFSGLSIRRLVLIDFQRPFDDVGDRATLSPGEAMGEVPRPGAANGKLRFRHAWRGS